MTEENLVVEYRCKDCTYYQPTSPNYQEGHSQRGECRNPESDHSGHTVNANHVAPWKMTIGADGMMEINILCFDDGEPAEECEECEECDCEEEGGHA